MANSLKHIFLLGLIFHFSASFAQWQALNQQSPVPYPVKAIAARDNLILVGTGSGVFLSTNGGNSFFSFSFGLEDSSITAVAISGNNLLAGTSNGKIKHIPIGFDIWLSENIGSGSDGVGSFFKNGNAIWANFISSCRTFRSTDDGNTWQFLATHGCFTNYVSSNNLLYHGDAGSVSVSNNNGQTWSPAGNGYNAFSDYALMGADEQGRIVISRGFWSTANASDDPLFYANATLSPQWQLTNSFANTQHGVAITSFAGYGNTLYAGVNNTASLINNGVHMSTDGGQTWTLDNALTAGAGCLFRDGNTLYAGLQNGQIWKKNLGPNVGTFPKTEALREVYISQGQENKTFKISNAPEQARATVLVYDEVGKLVDRQDLNTENLIKMNRLSSGLYILSVFVNGENKKFKVILN